MSNIGSPVQAQRGAAWFYLVDGQQRGPVSQQQLLQLSATGQVGPDTLVWRDGLANWVAFSQADVSMPMAMPAPGGVVLNYSQGVAEPTNIFGWWWFVLSKNYANASGRARRKEFWSFTLVNIMILGPLYLLAVLLMAGARGSAVLGIVPLVLALLIQLGLVVPHITAAIRRLHDSGKSGWLYLVGFVPYVGGLILLILLALDSTPGDNQYGPNPKSAVR